MIAECGEILVGGEAGAVGGELEQHAARLEEVDGLEPETIDHFGRTTVGLLHPLAHGKLRFVVCYAPCDVMHCSRAPPAAPDVATLLELDVLAGTPTANTEARPAVGLAVILELEDVDQEVGCLRQVALPRAHGVETAYLMFSRHGTLVPRREITLL